MPSIASAYRGPLVIIGLGSGFSVVGAVPVAITFSIGMKTSATIIGMGFVGFGFLLILPGLFWCVMVRTHSFKFWRRKRRPRDHRGADDDDEEEEATPALNNCSKTSDKSKLNSTPRERRWPPPYVYSPPLIVTDHCASSDRDANAVSTVTAGCGLSNAVVIAPQVCSYDNEDCRSENGNDPVVNDNGNYDDEDDNAATTTATAIATADDVGNNNGDAYVTAIVVRNVIEPTHAVTATPQPYATPTYEATTILTSV